jgi:tetratricopeptide (TPR) repeat protein
MIRPNLPNMMVDLKRFGNWFAGRTEELRRIQKAIIKHGVRAVTLHGRDGSGKSATAAAAVNQLSGHFDLFISLDCRGGLSADEMMVRIGKFLELNGIGEFDNIIFSPIPINLKARFLAQILLKTKVLVVLDNFEHVLKNDGDIWAMSDAGLENILDTFIKQCEKGTRFIFVSTHCFSITNDISEGHMENILFKGLSLSESLAAMDGFPSLSEENGGTKKAIYEKTGGHPFAIDLFGVCSANSPAGRLLDAISGRDEEDVVHALLDQAFNGLSERARVLAMRCSVYEKAVPLPGLVHLMKDYDANRNIDREIEELINCGLLSDPEEPDRATYQIHSIAREFMKGITDEGEWRKWQVSGADYHASHAGDAQDIWEMLSAHKLYFEANDFQKAGFIANAATERFLGWGLTGLVNNLNLMTTETTTGQTKAAALFFLGIVSQGVNEHETSVGYFERCLEIFQELGNSQGIASVLGQIGMSYHSLGDLEKAVGKYDLALEVTDGLDDRRSTASLLVRLGDIRRDQGKHATAVELLGRSLAISEELNDEKAISGTLLQLAAVHMILGEYAKAKNESIRSLELHEKSGDRQGIAEATHALADAHNGKGDLDMALQRYGECLKSLDELGDKHGVLSIREKVALIHQKLGDYERAEDEYGQHLVAAKALGDKQAVARSFHQMGTIHHHMGNLERAIDEYTLSLKIRESTGDRIGAASTMAELGNLFAQKKDYINAIMNLLTSLSIFDSLNSPYRTLVAEDLGRIEQEIGKEDFGKYYTKAIDEIKNRQKKTG